jgi:2-iminobutanoate/2-iminopropanoate deaminase
MGERRVVNSGDAPDPIGPYNHAIVTGGLLFCSGQIPLDPESGERVGETAADEATQCLQNLAAVCAAAGTGLENAVRLTIFTTVLDQFGEINEAYAAFFGDDAPARAVVGVAQLPKGVRVEIDAIVALSG